MHNLRHAAFDNEICGRPHVIWNIRFGGRAGVYCSKTNAWQENQSTRYVTIWMVMSQRVIEWIRNLCLNVLVAVLPTLRFSANLDLFFCGFAGLFEDLRVACFLWVSVLRIAFLSNFMAILLFQFTTKRNLGVFLCKLAHFGLVFSDLPPCSCM